MKIVFMGTPDFAVASLDAIVRAGHEVAAVVTVPDRATGRGLKLTLSPVKQYATAHGLPLLQPEKLRDPQFVAQLNALQADLFVVVAFRMLPQVVWALPPLGTFNLHASLLPAYRGAAPINWAIINGEKETGVTTFLLNEKIDEGAILLQRRTPITPQDTAETLHDRLAAIGSRLAVETIEGLSHGTLKPHAQPAAQGAAKLAPKIFKDDCAIHWDWPGEQIVDFVRGLSPYPAATMRLQDVQGATHDFKVFEVCYHPAAVSAFADKPANSPYPPTNDPDSSPSDTVASHPACKSNDTTGNDSAGIPSSTQADDATDRPSTPDKNARDTAVKSYPMLVCEHKKRLKISLISGNIEILQLQINGKRKNSSEEFLRGHNITDWKII